MKDGGVATRSAYFTAPGEIEIRSDTVPRPGPGEVLVHVRACGVCTMEQRLYKGVTSFYPISPGHEPAAEVVAVGDGVTSVQPGDHVIVSFLPRCMECYYCRAGESDKCVVRPKHEAGVPFRLGGFSEYAIARAYQLYKVSPDVSFAEASLGEPLACVIHSLRKAELQFGEDVLVVGGGTMGQLHVLLARLRGTRVMLSEPSPHKLRAGLDHGVAVGIDPLEQDLAKVVAEHTDRRGVDAIFITVGGRAGEQALKSLRKGGRAIFYSGYHPSIEMPVDPDWIHHSQVSLIGAMNQTPADWLQASMLLSKRLVDVRHLISATLPLEEIDQAMQLATNGETFRVVVELST